MQIHITGRHCAVSEALQQLLRQKIMRLAKFSPQLIEAHAILTKEKGRYTAELTLAGKGIYLSSKVQTFQARTSLEQVLNKCDQQLRRRHARLVTQQLL